MVRLKVGMCVFYFACHRLKFNVNLFKCCQRWFIESWHKKYMCKLMYKESIPVSLCLYNLNRNF